MFCTKNNESEWIPEIDGYEYEDTIGKSGCSRNYIFRRQFDNELFVVKVPLKKNDSFKREIQFLSYFQYDDEVVDLEPNESTNQILMTKYCYFGDLKTFLKQKGVISKTLFYKIFRELVAVICLLHSNQIFHGDIKPQNFFVKDYDAQTEKIKIVIGDFGFAKDLEYQEDSHVINGATKFYAAPEILRLEPVSLAADIYSLGIVIKQIIDEYVNEDIDPHIPGLIMKMLCQSPKERPTIYDVMREAGIPISGFQ